MEEGMGILRGTPGAPAGDEYGFSLGRGLGVGSTNDRTVSNTPLSPEKPKQAMESMPGMQHNMPGMQHGQMEMSADVSPNANAVPGFPRHAH